MPSESDNNYFFNSMSLMDIVSHSVMAFCFQYPSQACRLGLLYIWTKECEAVSVQVLFCMHIPYVVRNTLAEVMDDDCRESGAPPPLNFSEKVKTY